MKSCTVELHKYGGEDGLTQDRDTPRRISRERSVDVLIPKGSCRVRWHLLELILVSPAVQATGDQKGIVYGLRGGRALFAVRWRRTLGDTFGMIGGRSPTVSREA